MLDRGPGSDRGILIAGEGERRTLPLVARYADACSLRPGPRIPAKLEILRRQCDQWGTEYERIERTCAFALRHKTPKRSANRACTGKGSHAQPRGARALPFEGIGNVAAAA